MPLLTKTFQIVAGLLSIPIFGTAILAGNYASPFVMHLADVVNGTQTTVVAGTNAPNWSIGTPLTQVVAITAASSSYGSAASGLASSTTYSFAIAAVDPTGTTTLSNVLTFTTDASTTQTYPEVINLSWTPVAGATGYAIFEATGTVSSSSGFSQYFIATSSSNYAFSTSTGSLAGSYTKSDTTAFAFKLNPSGPSYIDGGNGTATGTPVAASGTALEINGGFRNTEVGTSTSCDAQTAGVIFYNTSNSHEWGCNGSTWVKIY
jgi:hypothetical protein